MLLIRLQDIRECEAHLVKAPGIARGSSVVVEDKSVAAGLWKQREDQRAAVHLRSKARVWRSPAARRRRHRGSFSSDPLKARIRLARGPRTKRARKDV